MKVQELRAAIRELATLEETSDPCLSVYLGVDGGTTAMQRRLQQRLQPIRGVVEGAERASLDEAISAVEQWIDREILADTRGIAVFARGGDASFLLALQFRTTLPESVTVDGLPSIYSLCELKDDYDCYVVLLATETTMRVLEIHLGAITRQIWRERPELRERVGREWTKEHLQSHRRVQSQRLVKEMISILEQRMSQGGYRHLILAGNPRVLATVREALPKRLREAVIDQLPASGSTPLEDVVAATLATFIEEEQRESASVVETLLAQLYRDGLAAVGEEPCFRALLHDQADRLVLSRTFDGLRRDELLRMAEAAGCGVEFVDDSDRLDRLGGVGCLLRYRAPVIAAGVGVEGEP